MFLPIIFYNFIIMFHYKEACMQYLSTLDIILLYMTKMWYETVLERYTFVELWMCICMS